MQDSLGDRMKDYENSFRYKLAKRMPVIIRVDGRSFHSLTKKCQKPFDFKLIDTMNETAIHLCNNIQNAKFAYIQSDEISILLNNWQELTTESFFDNNIQKMVSISAAIASSYFTSISNKVFDANKLVQFDSRAFILPKEEVNNYFEWRQQDKTRNSIQMLARSLFSHKECNNKNQSQLQEMIFTKGQNWNDLPTNLKRGRCVIKKEEKFVRNNQEFIRSKFVIDNDIPVFHKEPNYIEKWLSK